MITFETMPKAMAYLITKVEALEKALMEKNEAPAAPVDRWLNIDELKAYLPDHPVKSTIYGWVSKREIPYHKGGKKLRFLQSDMTSQYVIFRVRSRNDDTNVYQRAFYEYGLSVAQCILCYTEPTACYHPQRNKKEKSCHQR